MHVKAIFEGGIGLSTRHVQIRLEEDEYELLKQFAGAEKISIQEAGRRALEEMIANMRAKKSGPAPEVPSKLRHYVRKLAEVLCSGDSTIIRAVTSNLDVFHERMRPDAGRHKGQ